MNQSYLCISLFIASNCVLFYFNLARKMEALKMRAFYVVLIATIANSALDDWLLPWEEYTEGIPWVDAKLNKSISIIPNQQEQSIDKKNIRFVRGDHEFFS